MTPFCPSSSQRGVNVTWDESYPRRRAAGRALTCADVAETLPSLAGGETGVSRRVRSHVETCLRCQAEVAHYRRQRRQLRALRYEPVESDPGLAAPELASMVLARIHPVWEAHQEARAVRRSLARVGGISAVTVTVAGAGVLVWMSRRRLALAV
jgi:hypothetical protein